MGTRLAWPARFGVRPDHWQRCPGTKQNMTEEH